MKIIHYQEKYDPIDFLEEFLDSYYSKEMAFHASELLDRGLSPQEINAAVRKAITSGRTAGLDIRKHFYPLYTQRRGELVRDCKLSKMAYALVLLNANVESPVVAKWQIKVLENFIN